MQCAKKANIPTIPSSTPRSWEEIFAALDEAGVPDDFLVDREQGLPQERAADL